MSDIHHKHWTEVDYYKGPHAVQGIRFRTAGRELGLTAWGMNVIEIEAGVTAYPEHDHLKDGQEEVYVVLRGGGTMRTGGTDLKLEIGTMIRVGPGERRHITPGSDGIVVLALGGTPGKAYEPRR